MAMVNMNNLLNGKDSRWLQLEVCREFQRNKCTRPDTECKFAHPPANVEVQNGRVTACYDSIKGRCNRDKPPCKYFHPPQHLKDQLLINGRNHLALKNALMQQMGLAPGGQPLVPGQVPAAAAAVMHAEGHTHNNSPIFITATNPYLTGMPQVGSTFSPYFTPAGPIMPVLPPDPASAAAAAAAAAAVASSSSLAVVPQTMVAAAQKMPRSDRLEMDMKSVGSFYYDNFAFPGMVPYKRPAADKSGVPVYQPNATTYQQLMQLQQPFVPVSCEYSTAPSTSSSTLAPTSTIPTISTPSTTTSTSPSPSTSLAITHSVHDEGGGNNQVVAASQKMPNAGTESGIANAGRAPGGAPPNRQVYLKATRRLTPVSSAGGSVVSSSSSASSVSSSSSSSPSPMSLHHLNALSFTGVALNKQQPIQQQNIPHFPPPPPVASSPFLGPVASLPGYRAMLGTQITHSQILPQALLNHQNAFPRPPSSPFLQNPYALIGPQQPEQSQPMSTLLAQYAQMAAAGNANSILAAAMGLQPYKKMRTS